MELPTETDDFLRESVEYSLGLPISTRSLELKLLAYGQSQQLLKNQYHSLQLKLREKERSIELARSEASMNAQALKKFVEENQKLATECKKWENECTLYDRDREALTDFADEADERAKVAEERVSELEEDVRILKEEFERILVAEDRVSELEDDIRILKEDLMYSRNLVKALFEQNKFLDRENKSLQKKLSESADQKVPAELKKAITQARRDKKLTQTQLAQQINEKQQIIQEYESGKAIPNQQIISKLERVLGVKLRGKK